MGYTDTVFRSKINHQFTNIKCPKCYLTSLTNVHFLKAPTNLSDALVGRGFATAAEKETAHVAATATDATATAANEPKSCPSVPNDFRDVSTDIAAKKTSTAAAVIAYDRRVATKVHARLDGCMLPKMGKN